MGKWVVPRSCQPLPRCSWAMLRCSQKPPRCSWLTPRCCRPCSGAAGPCHGATGCCRSALVPGVPVQGLAAGPAARWGRLHVALEESCTGVGRNLGGGVVAPQPPSRATSIAGAVLTAVTSLPPKKKPSCVQPRAAGQGPLPAVPVPSLALAHGAATPVAGCQLGIPKIPPRRRMKDGGRGGAVPIPPPAQRGRGGHPFCHPPYTGDGGDDGANATAAFSGCAGEATSGGNTAVGSGRILPRLNPFGQPPSKVTGRGWDLPKKCGGSPRPLALCRHGASGKRRGEAVAGDEPCLRYALAWLGPPRPDPAPLSPPRLSPPRPSPPVFLRLPSPKPVRLVRWHVGTCHSAR